MHTDQHNTSTHDAAEINRQIFEICERYGLVRDRAEAIQRQFGFGLADSLHLARGPEQVFNEQAFRTCWVWYEVGEDGNVHKRWEYAEFWG